jgi:hypothetical protein
MTDRAPALRTVRQLYIYAVAAATLAIAAVGAVNLLVLGIDRILTAISGEGWIQDSGDWQRQRLSLYLPFVVIATPIWYLHWRMAQRAVRGDAAVVERRSLVRNLFLALVLVITGLQLLLGSLMSLTELAIAGPLGPHLQGYERESVVTSLAILIVGAAIWLFHLRAWVGDVRAETAETRESLPVPVYLYVASAVGLLVAIFGARDLIDLAVDAVAGDRGVGRWWRDPLARGVAPLVTGGVIWALHWPLTARLRRVSSWWGRGEQGASLRRVYLVAIPTVTALIALVFLAEGVDGVVRWATDVPLAWRETRATEIATPLLATLPPVGLWLLHRRWLLAEPATSGVPTRPETVARLLGYAMALVGLALATAGGARLAGEAIQALAGEDGWRRDIGWPLGMLIGGGTLWAWYWQQTRRRLARDPEAEQAATSRRAYLLLVLGGAVVALVVGLAMTVYQVLQRTLGVSGTGRLASDIALPMGITLVTAAVAVYHALLLRRDLAVRPLAEHEAGARVELVLTGPAGADLDEAVVALRRALPEGYAIERRGREHPAPPPDTTDPTDPLPARA